MNAVRAVALLLRTVLLVAVTAVAGYVVVMLVGHQSPNPLSTTHVDHDHLAMVQRLQDQSRYTAASERVQAVVDSEDKSDHLPSGIIGERTVLVAEGDVDASVDFSALGTNGVDVAADGSSVTVHLPPPELERPRIDPGRTSVVSRERGVVNRVTDAVTGANPVDDQPLYAKAETELADAADHSELRNRAEANTTTFVQGLFASMGYQHVTVVFDQPSPAAAA